MPNVAQQLLMRSKPIETGAQSVMRVVKFLVLMVGVVVSLVVSSLLLHPVTHPQCTEKCPRVDRTAHLGSVEPSTKGCLPLPYSCPCFKQFCWQVVSCC